MAASGLTVTSERSQVVDFNVGLVEDPLTLIWGSPKGEAANYTAYLHIFHNSVWIMIFTTCAILALGLVFIKWIHDGEKVVGYSRALVVTLLPLGQMSVDFSGEFG